MENWVQGHKYVKGKNQYRMFYPSMTQPVIPHQTNQLVGLRYMKNRVLQDSFWEGLFTPYTYSNRGNPKDGGNIQQPVKLSWLRENFMEEYLQEVKHCCTNGHNKYIKVLPGDSEQLLDMSQLCDVNYSIPIKFKQLDMHLQMSLDTLDMNH